MAALLVKNLRISQYKYLKPILITSKWQRSTSCISSNNSNIRTCDSFFSEASWKIENKCNQNIQFLRSFHTSPYRLKIVPFLLADIGEGIKEVVVKEWYVQEGDIIAQFDNVCEVQSDKASVTITSRYDGKVVKLYCDVDGIALVGNPLIDVEVEKEEYGGIVGDEVQELEAIAIGKATTVNEEADSFTLPSGISKVLTTPAVRRVAMEHKIDLQQVDGSGREGRILKEDVLRFIESMQKDARTPKPPKSALKDEPKASAVSKTQSLSPRLAPVILAKDKKEPIKGFKKAMVKTMQVAMNIPHFGYCDEIDMTSLVQLRPEFKVLMEAQNIRFSYLPIFIKAASMALSYYPIVNSTINEKCDEITYKASHNIGFAMDTKDGLVVPNIKGIQQLSIVEISEELMRLQACGVTGSFSSHDVTGGTFTLSNIGSIGGTYAKPLILPPESAIGALGMIKKLPRFVSGDDNRVEPRYLMPVSWSADHRTIDGATIARFSNLWKSYLENPSSMIFFMK